MNAPADAKVLGMEIARPETDLFVITEKGYGKRTPISEYPSHHRGGRRLHHHHDGEEGLIGRYEDRRCRR